MNYIPISGMTSPTEKPPNMQGMAFSSHFVFNSLSVIQHYIITDNKKGALSSLNKFGRLFRQYVLLMQNDAIEVEQEMNLLQIYLQLQELRYADKLSVTFHCCENIPPRKRIPSVQLAVILEDFLESLLKKGEKKLDIQVHFSSDANYLEVMMEVGEFRSGPLSEMQTLVNGHPETGIGWRRMIEFFNNQNPKIIDYSEKKTFANPDRPDVYRWCLSIRIPFI
jgi:LytS/YehU family sensor histidine kinase